LRDRRRFREGDGYDALGAQIINLIGFGQCKPALLIRLDFSAINSILTEKAQTLLLSSIS
jgi:hypothetical protein